MREDKALPVELEIIIVEQIKIDGAGGVAFPLGGAAEKTFDPLRQAEEFKWLEAGLYLYDGVVKRFRSLGAVYRISLVNG